MKVIQLTQGQVALVDDKFFEVISKDKWHAMNQTNRVIAMSYHKRPMHRVIMEMELGRKLETHESLTHKNRNCLDNRIENLMFKESSSPLKGISKTGNRWSCHIYVKSEKSMKYVGCFKTQEEAKEAYQKALADPSILIKKDCKRGHEKNETNGRIDKLGKYVCRVCARERDKKKRASGTSVEAVGAKCTHEGCAKFVINKYGLCKEHRLYRCHAFNCHRLITFTKKYCDQHRYLNKPSES